MATIRDVAERAQVSTATVSRVMNDSPTVNRYIREAVLQAAAALNFQPNRAARTLRTAKTRTLALVLQGSHNSDLVSQLLLGAGSAANEHGYSLLIANAQGDLLVAQRLLLTFRRRYVDGILCYPTIPREVLEPVVKQSDIPIVIYGRRPAVETLPHTAIRFAPATEIAIDDLLSLGHRRIGTITHVNESHLTPQAGWGASFVRQVLAARGIQSLPEHHLIVESSSHCAEAARALMAADSHPTALFVTNLFLAPATVAGIRGAGARVPDEVSIIAFGDSEWTGYVEPTLSVVAADLSAHLADATRLLINMINGNDDLPVAREQVARYIRRASVQAPPACIDIESNAAT